MHHLPRLLPALVTGSIMLVATLSFTSHASAQMRIGVFDSRAIAIAASRSSEFHDTMDRLKKEVEAATERNDTEEIARLQREGMLRQAMLHEQGFGRGSVAWMIEPIADQLQTIAEEDDLMVIVSRFEIPFKRDAVELIDITDKVVKLFKPGEEVWNIIKELRGSEPVRDAYLIKD